MMSAFKQESLWIPFGTCNPQTNLSENEGNTGFSRVLVTPVLLSDIAQIINTHEEKISTARPLIRTLYFCRKKKIKYECGRWMRV
jgi:hypothetical protein